MDNEQMTSNRESKESSEWIFQSNTNTIAVNLDELLLLDWCLCAPSRILLVTTLDDYLEGWKAFRYEIWAAIDRLNLTKTADATKSLTKADDTPKDTTELSLSDGDMELLLALVPTTFRWGTGVDCGYSLKQKLFKTLERRFHA